MENWRRLVLEYEDDDEGQGIKIVIGDDEQVEDEEVEDADLEEWKQEDDSEYESRKKERRLKRIMKTDRTSWVQGADALALGGLAKGIVEKKKKPRKPQCHAYNPFHGDDGEFVNPEKEKGSSSMKSPDKDSPDDCTWGQNRRSSANRSTQSTKRDCGRKGKYRCKDGTSKWEEEKIMNLDRQLNDGVEQQDAAYIRGIISQELKTALQQQMKSSGCNYRELLRMLNAFNAAEKGELMGKVEK
tara:strand:- start:162 stop:890 length:729 start_codon:yes stop_codon:yes gene_type:complete